MKNLLIIVSILISIKANAQTGFNKTYGFEPDLISASFMNVLLDNDTIVLFGNGFKSTPPYHQGLLFVKMDTFGNVLLQKFYSAPDMDDYVSAPNYEIIKTTDGGYLLIQNTYVGREGVLIKLSHEGDMEFYKKYPPALTSGYRKVLELEDGYLISGYLQMPDYDNDIFVMKTDKQGNTIWQKMYGEPSAIDIMGSLVKVNDNLFAVGSSQASKDLPVSTSWGKSRIFTIDSMGNVVDDWFGEENKERGIVGLNKLPDGWLYASATYEVLSPVDWGSYCKIVRRDEDYNLIWEKVVSTTAYYVNVMVDIKPTPDGNWVAVGRWVTPPPLPPSPPGGQYLPAFTYKFTTDGDSLWSRQDTIFWETDSSTWCASPAFTGGVGTLSSGSIVVVGYTDRLCVLPERSFGWVVKMSKDGCMDTLCVTTGLEILPFVKDDILVYPNPTSGLVTIDNCQDCIVDVFDALGNLMQHQQDLARQVDLSNFPNGVYVVRMSNGKANWSKKVVKNR
ncbi:MAG: T9SS C-terminal target domain-containing protein [Haliscomenobacteraceae bacterium CHB4]|nr:hypothetical protein [Saprospiraceae bacterium]MCE7923732.1 T9SS C-terminal target domain-containing protein [Haliscomenobacteraceae bacterium CHB4]